jgi:hypothetical protein
MQVDDPSLHYPLSPLRRVITRFQVRIFRKAFEKIERPAKTKTRTLLFRNRF